MKIHSYIKLFLLSASLAVAFLLYRNGTIEQITYSLNGHGYISVFLGGLMFTSGFTTPFAIAMFIQTAHTVEPIMAAGLAGFGAAAVELGMFTFFRKSLKEECSFLNGCRPVLWLKHIFETHSLLRSLRKYLLWTFAGLIIASPVPDEIGISLLGSIMFIDTKRFVMLCFIFNTLTIFLIFLATRALS